jgi:hypothetical protein
MRIGQDLDITFEELVKFQRLRDFAALRSYRLEFCPFCRDPMTLPQEEAVCR